MKQMSTTERYTAADLENWRTTAGDVDPPIRLGVFGDPVAHSLSPQMQNAALRACEIDMQYRVLSHSSERTEISPAFSAGPRFYRNQFDRAAQNRGVHHVDEADESARRAGAVNTIRVRDKKLIGSNTDGEGSCGLSAVILGRCARSAGDAYRGRRRDWPGDCLAMRARELRTPGPGQSHARKRASAGGTAATVLRRTACAWSRCAPRGGSVGGIGIARATCRNRSDR